MLIFTETVSLSANFFILRVAAVALLLYVE